MAQIARPDGALLAGVCADIARRLGWNVWVVRALFVLFLVLQTLATGVVYIALALVLRLADGTLGGADRKSAPPGGLASPDLADRGRRIEDLEARFRELERQGD